MSENKSNNSQSGFFSSPVVLIRVSSILVVLETVGHLSGYPWTSSHVLQETQLVHSMKAVDYLFFGERSSYWSLYSGWGLFIFVLLFTLAIILWFLSNLARLAPRQIGVITGIISAGLLACAYLSFRFFYLPSSLLLSATCLILLTAAVQLLRRPSSTSENKSNNKRLPGFFASPFVLFRVCSLLFVFLLSGHWSSYPWSSARNPQELHLVESMKSIDFVFMGEHQTYWGLHFGWGLLVGVLLFAMVAILWILSDLTRLAPRHLGVIAGIISAISMVGAYISFRFFYVPPFICYSAICVIMLTATVQLLGQQTIFTDRPGLEK